MKRAPRRNLATAKCPKCGGKMAQDGVCTKCNYSRKTAYRSSAEAREYTVAAD